MPRGFQINVEKGFDSLVVGSSHKTLLALLNDLDKHLEQFLTTEKAQTIKLIANADKRPGPPEPERNPGHTLSPPPIAVVPVLPSWTPQQKNDALAKRQADIRQLEARMGRVFGFTKSPDGTNFNLPVQIPKPARLPIDLQPLKEITLLVPQLYNLEPCTVRLKGIRGPEVDVVQAAFEGHAREKKDMSLMAHVNYLIQNIHTMASEGKKSAIPIEAEMHTQPFPIEQPRSTAAETDKLDKRKEVVDEERPHLHFIPRPPEWDRHDSEDGTDESSFDSDEYTDTGDESEGEEEAEQGGASLPVPTTSVSVDKGVHLSLPELELHNIELLSLVSLSLSVKCLRCKTPTDVSSIRAGDDSDGSTGARTRTESCPKCTTPFTFSYTPNALHVNTIRAGTIEVTGCTITDMLPSVFQPTCSSCSTTFPVPPGMISVRGDTPMQVCRSCHAKMTFTIHEVKFLRVSHASTTLPLRRPKKENLGIAAGTPLPNNGTCPHYRHSYRWFRFSCCNRVHACDRCHDAAEEHVNERAERMVCGWCSREQRFRSEECGICGRSVIRRRKVGGFWEGGQGTRDRKLMSRNEKRKYKRPSAKEAAAQQGKKQGK
ncbi:hypothetical protein H2200_008318 [Cladophialophora chaetospira]|uniref:CHY-type domain-containing protein n=1 Tax=Cladophialophora chaetospira TaxID=386627 RepID=A0AA38X5P0_9EURO|nr:hypothetical protein H2200_008318 [Cladophialophora chaetospira]